MIVLDASVVVTALGDGGEDGVTARARLVGATLFAPELLDLEVVSVFRRFVGRGEMAPARAQQAVNDLIGMPIERVAHRPLLSRCWELRENLTSYDAAYVALAELLDAPLLTADARLANSPGPRCAIEVLSR